MKFVKQQPLVPSFGLYSDHETGGWVVGIVVVLGCGGFGAGDNGGGSQGSAADLPEARRRLDRLYRGVMMYATENDGVLPLASNWYTSTFPYVQGVELYRSPLFDGTNNFGFALNADWAGKNPLSAEDESLIPLFFDSTNLSKGAVASPDTMPNPGRYGGTNGVVYADGFIEGLPATIEVALQRTQQLATGIFLYAADYDDRMLTGPGWYNQLYIYVKRDRIFRSPLFDRTENYGFALNPDILGVPLNSIANPTETPVVYDSTVLTRNAIASFSTLPNPGRYEGKNAVGYADGTSRSR